jgi:hypothetical protein
VTVQEEELGAASMGVGVDVALGGHGREAPIVEEPDEFAGRRQLAEAGGMGFLAGAIDPAIEHVVEEEVAVAHAAIAGTDPQRAREGNRGIGPPRAGFGIGRKSEGARQVDVPPGFPGDAVGGAVRGETIVVIQRVLVGGETPLTKLGGAGDAANGGLGAGDGGGEGSGEEEENGDGDQEFEEGESRPPWLGAGGLVLTGEIHNPLYSVWTKRLLARPGPSRGSIRTGDEGG